MRGWSRREAFQTRWISSFVSTRSRRFALAGAGTPTTGFADTIPRPIPKLKIFDIRARVRLAAMGAPLSTILSRTVLTS